VPIAAAHQDPPFSPPEDTQFSEHLGERELGCCHALAPDDASAGNAGKRSRRLVPESTVKPVKPLGEPDGVILAVTLKGHPLAGRRYWRVYSIGANEGVVETGAYDQPGPAPLNYVGYYLSQKSVSSGWRGYLQFIQRDL
jgi:hypothetical protein